MARLVTLIALLPFIAAVIFVFSAINDPAATGGFVGDTVSAGWEDVKDFTTALFD